AQPQPEPSQVWPCPLCTFLNRGSAPTCDACGHAPSRDITSGKATPPRGVASTAFGSGHASSGALTTTSGGRGTTSGSGSASHGVNLATSGSERGASGFGPASAGSGSTSSGSATPPGLAVTTSGSVPAPSGVALTTSESEPTTSGSAAITSSSGPAPSGCGPAPSRDALRQRKLLEDGRRLVALVRAAESQGLPPEALSPALFAPPPRLPAPSGPAPTPEVQIRHFRSHLREVLKALAGEGPHLDEGGASLGPFSLVEAAWAWLEGEGSLDRARCALIGRRKQQLQFLATLGFPDRVSAAGALQRHGGGHWGALRELQRAKLR
ncbi:RNF31 ligase, partial [Erpornis zantholeuca]|nr:RNF31 ligase [Erpornis zantholeuca]